MQTSRNCWAMGAGFKPAPIAEQFRLKEKQKEAIRSILSGKDTFVSLPTGYGKSLIYAALPLTFDRVLDIRGSIVVCVSPLSCPDAVLLKLLIHFY